jgi:hypothetical protein
VGKTSLGHETAEYEIDFKTPTIPGVLLAVPSMIISIAGAVWALDLGKLSGAAAGRAVELRTSSWPPRPLKQIVRA